MIIDWYTIIFQIINFLILVFLLRYFLYGPIVRMMDEREAKIVEREEKAETQRREAEEEAAAYRTKNEELEKKQDELLDKARASAEEEKSELLKEARQEVSETRRRWEEALEREQEAFITELRRRISLQASAVARRCLADLADARLEELTWQRFIKKAEELSDEDREELQKGLESENYKLNLLSAFEPEDEQVEELEKVLEKMLPEAKGKLKLNQKVDQTLLCGLELEAGGYRVSWNIESYLDGLEADILKELSQSSAPQAQEEEEVPAGDQPAE